MSAYKRYDSTRQWYTIHTYAGYEEIVADSINQRIDSVDMADKIFDVLVPKEKQIEIKNGKRKVVEKKIFQGYVLVEMKLSEDTWFIVRNTPGVTGFVGSGIDPTPVPERDIARIGGFVTGVITFFTTLGSGIISSVSNTITSVIQFFRNMVTDSIRVLTDFVNRGVQIGRDIINGIVDGLRAAGNAVVNFLIDMANNALDQVKAFFGIASPSKVFRDQVGKQLGAGMALGIKASTGGVIAQAKALSAAATDAAEIPAVGVGMAAGVNALNARRAAGAQESPEAALLRQLLVRESAPIELRAFIGDTELKDMVRVEVVDTNRQTKRTVRAGGRA